MHTLIFPSSYFDIKKVDEDLQAEYNAALQTGLFEIILFDYEKWFHEDCLAIRKKPMEPIDAIYRGWMMLPEQYHRFYHALNKYHIQLKTTPVEYERLHSFPNVYPCFAGDTARILLYPLRERIDISEIRKQFSKFMVKDYVKSVKGTGFPACFDETTTQSEFDSWMETFYQHRGDLLTGGICVKEYLSLKKYGARTNEFRVFYMNGIIASISENSGQGSCTQRPPMTLLRKYASLQSPFYTIDFAELEDERWVVIEAGDGQVSGLSDYQDDVAFYRALYYCMQ